MLTEVFEKIWQRSGGKCECARTSHNHSYIRCNKKLIIESQDKPVAGGWKLYQHFAYGGNDMNAYAVYCWECYQKIAND
jgi:hypothetical protein